MSSTDLNQLAWDLDAHGFAGRDAAVRNVVRSARVAGLSPVLIAVLAEPSEPEAARLRAFGKLAMRLAAVGRRATPELSSDQVTTAA